MMKQIVQAALAAIVLLFAVEAIAADVPDCNKLREDGRACLACNIYQEARSQSEPGQYAVALVTLNRVKSKNWPNEICEVVWQRWQFSWTNDGKSDKIHNPKKWEEALAVADSILTSLEHGMPVNDITNNAYYYHATYVHPKWAPHKQMTVMIGDHVFYTDPPQVASK